MGLEIDFLPVGDESKSGDAIALRYGNLFGGRGEQTVVVIDGGFKDTGDSVAEHLARYYGTRHVDVLVSTHPDDDHIRGLITLMERDDVTVGEVWLHMPWEHNLTAKLSRTYARRESAAEGSFDAYVANAQRLYELAVGSGVPVREPFTGVLRSGHGFDLTVVGPDLDYYGELVPDFGATAPVTHGVIAPLRRVAAAVASWAGETLWIETLTDAGTTSAANNSSVILLLTDGEHHTLLTGDAGMPALERAIDRLSLLGVHAGEVEFVQVPHHGSRHNVGPTVLDTLFGPKGTSSRRGTAFCSAAVDGSPRHPAKMVTNAFRRRCFPVFTTRGSSLLHHRNAPDRGWPAATPEPLHDKVENFED